MSVERITRANKQVRYRVRWREHGRNRAETFDRLRDAQVFDGEVRRRRQLGILGMLDAGEETLDHYVAETWTPSHTAHLAARTVELYTYLYDRHISPQLGPIPIRD